MSANLVNLSCYLRRSLMLAALLVPSAMAGDVTVSDKDVISLLPGIAAPQQHVTLSAPLNGVLRELHVREGAEVKQGQVLAVMDNRVAARSATLARAQADRKAAVARAERALKLAQRTLARLESIRNAKAISEVEVDQATTRRDLAKVALKQAKEEAAIAMLNYDLEKARLEAHEIRAPFTGRVLRVPSRVGQTLTGSDAVLTLANFQTLRVDLHVSLEWFGKLVMEQQYELAAAAPVNRRLSAKLVWIEPVVNPATKSFRCVFEIENTDALPGGFPGGFMVRLLRPKPPGREGEL